MSDTEDGLDEAFKGFGEDPAPVTSPTDPATPPAAPGAAAEPPKADPEPPKPAEEPKKDEEPPKPDDKKPEEAATPPADPEKKPEEGAKPPETPETPAAAEPSQPLTKDDVKSVVSDLLNTERTSSKELETTTKEVMDAYYPEGLTNTLTTPEGKELKTPQDVVEVAKAQGNEMTTDQAAQWLMNEQFKLDKQVAEIRDNAKQIAETTVNFRRDSMTVLQKYEPLFKAYPSIQKKVFDKLMEQVKVDKDKGVILSAPDVMSHYDFYLEPYQQAYEFSTKQPATAATPPVGGEPPKPGAEDRLDEPGDGGQTPANDPTDFAQQVTKELAKGDIDMENMPKGIGFYNIQTGETRYAQLEAQIQANHSSDMGINASRDQDFYWRLEAEWVKRVRAFRKNETKMELLTNRNGGQKVTTTQILYAIYGEQIRAAQERADENETPFEEDYLAAISSKDDPTQPESAVESVSEEDLKEEPPVNSPDDLKEEEPTPPEDAPAPKPKPSKK